MLVGDFQAARPLSIAEVWALPILLRLALLESLARTVASLGLSAQAAAPPEAAHTQDVSRGDDLAPPPPDQIVASCIRSLRTLDTADWKAFFEQINATERVLRTDPAGVYARMNFDTRDRYRKVVEELAAGSDDSEEAVAAAAVRLAGESPADRRAHVGYYLVDAGFDVLARTVGYHPRWKTRWRRFLTRYPTASYLGGIAGVTLAHEVVLCLALRALGAGPFLTAVAAALALVPATTIGVALINALITHILPPRVLPKMDFRKGIPADCQTLVVVPALLTDPDDAAQLVSKLEIRRLANADPHLHFALLTDFSDAAAANHARGRRAAAASMRRRADPQRQVRQRTGRSISSAASPPPVESGRGMLDGVGAQARQVDGAQPAARRRSAYQLRPPCR